VSRLKLLVVDDSTTDVDLLRLAFDRQGEEYELEVLEDGADALAFVERHRHGFDAPDPCAILLDVNLPKYGGIEILKAIKREPALAHVQVVMFSVFASPQEQAEIHRLGAVYRTKPTFLPDFIALGAEIIALCRQAVDV
jgi:two-component system response regulator